VNASRTFRRLPSLCKLNDDACMSAAI